MSDALTRPKPAAFAEDATEAMVFLLLAIRRRMRVFRHVELRTRREPGNQSGIVLPAFLRDRLTDTEGSSRSNVVGLEYTIAG